MEQMEGSENMRPAQGSSGSIFRLGKRSADQKSSAGRKQKRWTDEDALETEKEAPGRKGKKRGSVIKKKVCSQNFRMFGIELASIHPGSVPIRPPCI